MVGTNYETQTSLQLIIDKGTLTGASRTIADNFNKAFSVIGAQLNRLKLPTSLQQAKTTIPPSIYRAQEITGTKAAAFERGRLGLPAGSIYGEQGIAPPIAAGAGMANIAGRAVGTMATTGGKIVGGLQATVAKGAEITGGKGFEALKIGAIMGTVVSLLKEGNDAFGFFLKMFKTMFSLLILPLILLLTPIIVPILRAIAEHTKAFVEAMKTGNIPKMAIEFLPLAATGLLAILALGVAKVTVDLITGALSGLIGKLFSTAGDIIFKGSIPVGLSTLPTSIAGFLGTPIGIFTIGQLLGAGIAVAVATDILVNKKVSLEDMFGAFLAGWLITGTAVGGIVALGIVVTVAILLPGLENTKKSLKGIQQAIDRLSEVPVTIPLPDKQLNDMVTNFTRLKTSGEKWAAGDWWGAITTGAQEALVGLEAFGTTLDKMSQGKAPPLWDISGFGKEMEHQAEIINARIVNKLQVEGKGEELVSTLSKEMIDSFAAYGPPTLAAWDVNVGMPFSKRLGESQPTLGPLAKPTFFERGRDMFVLLSKGMMSFAEPLMGIVTQILDSIVQAFNKALTDIVAIVNKIIEAANRAAAASAAAARAATIQVPKPTTTTVTTKKMQEGGIVTSPTFALLGENYKPEAVVPLEKGLKNGLLGKGNEGGNVYVTNNITVSPGADKGEMKKLFSDFAREQGRELRRRTSYVGGIYA